MTPALLSMGTGTGTRIYRPESDDGEARRWMGTALPEAEAPVSKPTSGEFHVSAFAPPGQTSPGSAERIGSAEQPRATTWSEREAWYASTGAPLAGMPGRVASTTGRPPDATSASHTGEKVPTEVGAHATVLWQRSFLSTALVALKRVAHDRGSDEAIWMDAAQRLRRAAIVGRSRAPRHAALALIFCDALTFTMPEDLSEKSWAPLVRGLVALQEPFISSDRERAVIRGLLDGGWSLTGPFDLEAFSSLAPDLFD